MSLEILFAYGGLKRGFDNHFHIVGTAKYLGLGASIQKYAMYRSGAPIVLKHEKISKIYGELYQVSSLTLNSIDQLQGHPDWYRREKVEIRAQNNQVLHAPSSSFYLYSMVLSIGGSFIHLVLLGN